MSTANPDRILRELSELWSGLGKEGETQDVLRACTMTLLVLAEEAENPAAIWETIAALMPDYPSRAILVRVRRGAERDVSARVFAQCWLPTGRGRQICCEQIEIAATDAGVPDLPGVVFPLFAPDLPLLVWCRCRRLFDAPELRLLSRDARKLIADSANLGSAPGSLRSVLQAREAGLPVADLAWTRLTRWRELVSEAFDEPAAQARLAAAQEVRIAFGGEAPPPEAFYMAAWLLEGVLAAGGSARHHLDPVAGEPADAIRSVAVTGGGLDVSVELSGGGCAEIRGAHAPRRAVLAPLPEHVLLAEEARLPSADPHFEKTLPLAARLGVSSSA